MLARIEAGMTLLHPLAVRKATFSTQAASGYPADARIEIGISGEPASFRFVVECKSRSTPEAIESAIATVRKLATPDQSPMVFVPFLSQSRLAALENEGISGIDMCGNGIVSVPNRLLVYRTGHPNKYPDSRAVANPYKGKSSMVARLLVAQHSWGSLKDLKKAIHQHGVSLSLSQISKAIKVLAEDLVVEKANTSIRTTDPERILDNLGRNWTTPTYARRQYVKLGGNADAISSLAKLNHDESGLSHRWCITGVSSVKRYVSFGQGAPIQVAVADIDAALSTLNASKESVPSFADLDIIESRSDYHYFASEVEKGVRWASKIQTWLELQNGDARQRDAARDLRKLILSEAYE